MDFMHALLLTEIRGQALACQRKPLVRPDCTDERCRITETIPASECGKFTSHVLRPAWSTQRRCKTVNDTTQNIIGHDVTHRLGDKEGTARTSFKPGATLPVKHGEVVTTPPASS